jgi:[ribosomal protein S5]-alanine N-acetyltransferase
MAATPPLATRRLVLEPFAERHLSDIYVGWLQDPRVVQFSDQRFRRHTLDSCREYARSFDSGPNYFWAILLRGDPSRHIGTMTAYVDEPHRVADIGILMGDTSTWGRGFASEAFVAACDYLFRKTTMRKITAGTIEPNAGMIGVMKKAGMVEDGRRTGQALWNGEAVDVVHSAVFRDAWLNRHPDVMFEQL